MRLSILTGLALIAGCQIVQPEFEKLDEMVAAPFRSVKIMSWNLHAGKGLDGVRDIRRAAAVIKTASPDVAALQEIDRGTGRSGGVDQLAELEQGTGMHATWCRAIDFDGGEYGIAVLSKDEPISVRRVELPGAAEKRMLLIVDFPRYTVGCTHLSLDAAERLASAAIIRSQLDPGKPFFLAGDWNERPEDPAVRELRKPFALVSGRSATFPANAPNRCIDYVAVSRRHYARFEHTEHEVLPECVISDHRPVLVKLR